MSILFELKNKARITLDDALAIVYKNFPNGLTPDEDSIKASLSKFANKSSGGWVYNKNSASSIMATKHSIYIYNLIKIAKKLRYEVYIGKREQPETILVKDKECKLRDFVDYLSMPFEKLGIEDNFVKSRVEMIDVVFIKDSKIVFAIEVENSTNIISALHRVSVLNDNQISRIIVIPNDREQELLKLKDPLSLESINKGKWKYLLYSDLDKLVSQNTPSIDLFLKDIK